MPTLEHPITDQVRANLVKLHDRMTSEGVEHFNMDHFAVYYVDHGDDDQYERVLALAEVGPYVTEYTCGYAACLAGWAAVTGLTSRTPDIQEVTDALGIARPSSRLANDGITEQTIWYFDDAWFYVASWPQWAADQRVELHLRYIETHPELTASESYRLAEYNVVLGVLDDLIHGRRQHWFDGDTTAVDHADLVDANTTPEEF